MTTIAFDGTVMASDSRVTDDVGAIRGKKLFKKRIGKSNHLIGIAGDVYAAMVFVDWYGTGKAPPGELVHSVPDLEGFEVLIWTGKKLFTANKLCRLVEVEEPKYAIGSGAPYAMTAMDCGKSAEQAVRLACRRDPSSGLPVITMTLEKAK
jgi:ATP-dependent protease HslVU (ClpYQ) peptidase subunit